MIPLMALWLPIPAFGCDCIFASFITHVALGYHKSDYPKLPTKNVSPTRCEVRA
jgi:hypothetical protein